MNHAQVTVAFTRRGLEWFSTGAPPNQASLCIPLMGEIWAVDKLQKIWITVSTTKIPNSDRVILNGEYAELPDLNTPKDAYYLTIALRQLIADLLPVPGVVIIDEKLNPKPFFSRRVTLFVKVEHE